MDRADLPGPEGHPEQARFGDEQPQRAAQEIRVTCLVERAADERFGGGRCLGHDAQLEAVAAKAQGAEDDAGALDRKTVGSTRGAAEVSGAVLPGSGTADHDGRMLIPLRRGEHPCRRPAAGMRHQREAHRPLAQ